MQPAWGQELQERSEQVSSNPKCPALSPGLVACPL